MTLFFIGAITAYLLSGWWGHYIQNRTTTWILEKKGWSKAIFGVLFFIVLLSIIAIGTFLAIATDTRWFSYMQYEIARGLTGHSTTRLILGAISGIFLHHWLMHKKSQSTEYVIESGADNNNGKETAGNEIEAGADNNGKKPTENGSSIQNYPLLRYVFEGPGRDLLLIFIIILFVISSDVISSFKTPIVEMTMMPTISHREPLIFDPSKEQLLQSDKNIQQYAIQVGSQNNMPKSLGDDILYLENVVPDKKDTLLPYYKDAEYFSLELVAPVATCIYAVREAGLDMGFIQEELRTISVGLRRILYCENDIHGCNEADLLKNAKKNVVNALTAMYGGIGPYSNDSDVDKYCKEPIGRVLKFKGLINGFVKLRNKTPFVHLALSGILWFQDNLDASIRLLKQIENKYPPTTENMNFYYFLSNQMYYADYFLEDVIKYYQKTMNAAENGKQLVQIEQKKQQHKNENLVKLEARYEKASIRMMNIIAYLLAKNGHSELRAKQYAITAYESVYGGASTIDTFGYVRMAFEARKKRPDIAEIKAAASLFEEAIHQASLMNESSSLNKRRKQAALRLFRSHKRQAQQLIEQLEG